MSVDHAALYDVALSASVTADKYCIASGRGSKTADGGGDGGDDEEEEDGDEADGDAADDSRGGAGHRSTGLGDGALLRTHVCAFQYLSDAVSRGDIRWKCGGPLVPKTANKTIKPCLINDHKSLIKNSMHVDVSCSADKFSRLVTRAKRLSSNPSYLRECGITCKLDELPLWLGTGAEMRTGALTKQDQASNRKLETLKRKVEDFKQGHFSLTQSLFLSLIPLLRFQSSTSRKRKTSSAEPPSSNHLLVANFSILH